MNRLACKSDFAALLYTWMIPHAEEDGTITADAEELLYTVCPARRDKDAEDVQSAVDLMREMGLLILHDDQLYFPVESFYRYQSNVQANRRRESDPETTTTTSTQSHSAAPTSTQSHSTAPNASSSSPSPSPSPSPSTSSTLDQITASSDSKSASNNGSNGSKPTEFDAFWTIYPNKKGKKKAREAFKTACKEASAENITAAISSQTDHLMQNGPEFCPHPTTWLHQGRWEDEITPEKTALQKVDEYWGARDDES